jgi:tetratricopeptide (TPR) repeat protein
MPSLAFCILIAYLIVIKLPGILSKYQKFIMPLFLVILVLFSYKTINRNRVWESSQRLYATDVVTSSRSAKSNYDYAVSLSIQAEKNINADIKSELFEKSLVYLRKALSIYPRFTAALVSYADISFKYRLNADTAILYYEKARMIDSTIKTINNSLGTLYGQYKGDYDRAILFFNKDIKNNNATVDTYKKLAMCYFFKKDSAQALIFADKGLQLEPDNPELMQIHNLSSKANIH